MADTVEDTDATLSAAVPRHLFFETQRRGHCGVHALNNAIGGTIFTAEDMIEAVRDFLWEHAFEQSPEEQGSHINEDGWFSIELMSYVFRWKIAKEALGGFTEMRLDTNNPVQPTLESAARLRAPTALGLVVNIRNVHWVAFHHHHHT